MTLSVKPSSTATSDDEQREALSAPVGDPVWLLARQWQTGAFMAVDSGTPVRITVQRSVGPLTISGASLSGPVEPSIEAEHLPGMDALDTASRVEIASELVRRLRDAGVSDAKLDALRADWSTAFRLTPAVAGSALASYGGRLFDPAGLYHLLVAAVSPDGTGGTFPSLPGVDAADRATVTTVEAAVRAWFGWVSTQVAAPGATATLAPAVWDEQRLEYTFSANGQIPTGSVSLPAAGYDGSGVDWYTFDRGAATPGPNATAVVAANVQPVPVTYAGMPRPRFWEFEDGDVNLDELRASTDPGQAVLATFAHEYANDWFLIPLDLQPGTCVISQLQVVDTFGTVTNVPAVAAIDADRGPWRLWELSSVTGQADAATGLRVFLPPSPAGLAGPVLEDILVARDELANLAWIIELITRDADGTSIDRYQRWLRLRPPTDPTFNPSTRATPTGGAVASAGSYRLGTTIPDFWYPLIATTVNNHRVLRLATLPPEATGVPDRGVRGELIAHTPNTSVAEEEASREGNRVTRQDRLTLGSAGVIVWRARLKRPGEGESSSGLRFDIVEPTAGR